MHEDAGSEGLQSDASVLEGATNDWGTGGNWTANNRPDTTGEGATIDTSIAAAAGDFPVSLDINTSVGFLKINSGTNTGLSITTNRGVTIVNTGASPPAFPYP